MLPQEKAELFAILQDIADELRRIDYERKKPSEERKQEPTPLGVHAYGIPQGRTRSNLRKAV